MKDRLYRLHWKWSKARELPGIHKKLHELRKENELTPKEWKNLQTQRLRALLIFAKNHVPYYRRVFEKICFDPEFADLPCEFQKVPVLTKQIIKENLSDLLADNVERFRVFENATGGSTGIPLQFYQDLQYHTVSEAIDVFVRDWWGIKPYDRTALIWGADREFRELSFRERLYQLRSRTRSLNAFRMNEEDLGKFCKIISTWRPTYLMGYSSALEALAKFAQTMGYDNLRFKAIRSAAEMLWPHQRKLIEETFKSPVFNFYGSREVSNLASECPEKGQLHHISTWRYIEIVNEQGDPVQNGEPGYIVVTDLSNKTMPFIRYLNEDFGMMSGGLCTCGRPSPIIDHLFGRSSDLIRTPKGDIIHGEFFTHLFYGREGIDQFQVEQSSLNEIIVRYVPNDKWRITSINEIERRIQDRVGGDVSVILEACDKIPISKSGKHRFTISKVDALEGLKKSLKGTYFGTEFA